MHDENGQTDGTVEKPPRWYVYGTAAFTLAIFPVQMLVVSVRIGSWHYQSPADRWAGHGGAPVFFLISILFWLLFVTWFAWVQPVATIGRMIHRSKRSPRRVSRQAGWLTWIPTLLLIVLGIFALSAPLSWPLLILLGMLFGMVSIGSLFVARRVQRRLRERAEASAARQKLCFECSYSLHGLAGPTCPECGTEAAPPAAASGHDAVT